MITRDLWAWSWVRDRDARIVPRGSSLRRPTRARCVPVVAAIPVNKSHPQTSWTGRDLRRCLANHLPRLTDQQFLNRVPGHTPPCQDHWAQIGHNRARTAPSTNVRCGKLTSWPDVQCVRLLTFSQVTRCMGFKSSSSVSSGCPLFAEGANRGTGHFCSGVEPMNAQRGPERPPRALISAKRTRRSASAMSRGVTTCRGQFRRPARRARPAWQVQPAAR